jgi:hypothetical protein
MFKEAHFVKLVVEIAIVVLLGFPLTTDKNLLFHGGNIGNTRLSVNEKRGNRQGREPTGTGTDRDGVQKFKSLRNWWVLNN